MKESSNHKKGVMVGVIAALVLVVALGVTFAIYNYSKVGENQILVAGDIYMKYTGTNQINATDILPIDINNYYSDRYIINPNMTEEELSICENYMNTQGAQFDKGSDARSFCEGTGTQNGMTFKETFDNMMISIGAPNYVIEQQFSELIVNNVIKKEGFIPKPVEYRYVRNASMTEEELSSCESFINNMHAPFDEGSSARSFCEGTGTANNMAFQNLLDNPQFILQYGEELKSLNIIKEEKKEYPAIPYFEFKIEGVNNYSKDIWYEIVLKDGEEPEGRSERIRDDLLRFRLVEVVGEEEQEQEIFTNRSYEDISDEKIYVSTINANTTEKITRTYRLYMWISDSVKVGVGEGIDYDMETWNNEVYASVKINVAGDFIEKKVNYTQPAYCFMTQEFDNNGKTEIMITDYNKLCGSDVVIPKEINGHEVTVIGSASKTNNEGYIHPMAFSQDDEFMSFADKGLTSVLIPNTVRKIGSAAFAFNNLIQVEIPDSVEWIDEEAFTMNLIKKAIIGNGIKYIGRGIFNYYFSPTTLKELQIKKTCEEIKNIPSSPTNLEQKEYPFVSIIGQDGLDVYGYEDGTYKLCEHLDRNS